MRKRSKKCLKMHAEYTKRERRMSILLSEDQVRNKGESSTTINFNL